MCFGRDLLWSCGIRAGQLCACLCPGFGFYKFDVQNII